MPLRDKGCVLCRSRWLSWSDQPKLLGVSPAFQVRVYRCDACGAFWEEGIVYPTTITADQARERLPWLT